MPSPIVCVQLESWVDPQAAFRSLSRDCEAAVWLDSSRSEAGLARFSFMAFADAERGATVRYRSATRELSIRRHSRTEVSREAIFNYLARELATRPYDPSLPFHFQGGFAGYLGYELKGECGAQAAYLSDLPDAAFVLADHWLVFDHLERSIRLCATSHDSAWFQNMSQRLRAVHGAHPAFHSTNAIFRLTRPRQQYLADIRRCRALIYEGESYELCLTNEITAELTSAVDPQTIYAHLRRINPAPYAAFLNFSPACGDFTVLSSSPERFLSIDPDGWIETKPIKGTRRRGATPAEDLALKDELRTSTKDRAENLMITDLMRNDLGRVCRVGSVTVPKLMDVETYATVHQLVSTVRGQLRPDQTAIDCIRAAFPGGSMTGAPKQRTMSLLDELECAPRGIYSGAIGYLSGEGAVDLSIAIRTIIATGNRLSLGTGGAIVALSNPDAEFDETLLKARAQIAAILSTIGSASDVKSVLDDLTADGCANPLDGGKNRSAFLRILNRKGGEPPRRGDELD